MRQAIVYSDSTAKFFERYTVFDNPLWLFGLDAYDGMAYVALKSYCDQNGECFPGLTELSRRALQSVARLKTSLGHLRHEGLLLLTEGGGERNGKGEFASNRYRLRDPEEVARERGLLPAGKVPGTLPKPRQTLPPSGGKPPQTLGKPPQSREVVINKELQESSELESPTNPASPHNGERKRAASRLLKHAGDSFKERMGLALPIDGPRDAGIFLNLLRGDTEDLLRAGWTAYLESADPFAEKNGWSVPTFKTLWPGLKLAVTKGVRHGEQRSRRQYGASSNNPDPRTDPTRGWD